MPVSTPPTFSPAYFGISLGAAGTVLTSNGVNAAPTFQAAASVTGALVTVVATAGASNDVNPGSGFPVGISRVDVNTAAGAANWTGLLAGSDDQNLILRVLAGGNDLTLNSENAGSTAANRFSAAADFTIVAGSSITLRYYAGTINRWVVVP